MKPKKLEQYKYFQPIAWILCIVFAGFVGTLALELQSAIEQMEASSVGFETRLQNIESVIGVNPTNTKSDQ